MPLVNVSGAYVAVGDIDADVDLDLMLSGQPSSDRNEFISYLYRNTTELVTGIDERTSFSGEAKVVPNPAHDVVEIICSEKIKDIQLYSLTGELLMTKKNMEKVGLLNLSEFKNGMYLIVIRTNSNVYTRKIIKQ